MIGHPADDAPLLRVESLTKEFGRGHLRVRAVEGVDLECREGEITLVMGPSGSGKTTLLSMIGAILRPTSGRIVIAGTDITALRPRELVPVRRELVGFVFQTFNLLEALTALENVEIALNVADVRGTKARDRARLLLEAAGLGDRLHFNARDLSAGERQRVAIARALANRPRVVLADEPTANLDSGHGRDVMTLLRKLTRESRCAALIVSHDARLAEVADQMLWLEDGRLASVPPDRLPPTGAPPRDDGGLPMQQRATEARMEGSTPTERGGS